MSAGYLRGIWAARHFWTHLSLSDLRSRWRRSFLGAAWSVIQPLGMTLLISFVFSRLFGMEITHYAPYILSGMVVWECVTATSVAGALAFVQADAYIKQCRHPLAIYTLRIVLTNLVVLALAATSLLGWVLVVMPEHFGPSWFAALLIFPLLALIVWPMATLFAYVSTRFRDLPHALGLIFQAMWFVSPVYFEESFFRKGGLDFLLDYNPIYHLLQVVRAPLLAGEWPTVENYSFCLATAALLLVAAWRVGRNAEQKVIFYL